MNQAQLENLINDLVRMPKENEYVEFKESYFEHKAIGEKVSGLANGANVVGQQFAYLVFGISDEGHDVVGTSFSLNKKIGNEEFEHWLVNKLDPHISVRFYEFFYDAKPLVLIEIPAAVDRPVTFDRVAYVRIGSLNKKLKDFPDKERVIWNNNSNKNFEKAIAMKNVKSDEVLQLLDYSGYFTLTAQPLPSSTKGFLEVMEQDKLIIRKSEDDYNITNLGAILFANDVKKFDSIKRKSVRVIIYKGKDRIERVKEQEGAKGYAVGFEGLVGYINGQLPSNEEIKKALRIEKKMYPEVAIRELVANALIHQDFNEKGTGPVVEIFEDRVEITNPGNPLISTERFIDSPPQSRNEDLASFMRRIKICEEGGTGIDRVVLNIELFQLPAPKFEALGKFTKTTLYAHKALNKMDSSDKVRACYQHCVLRYLSGEKMTNMSLRERFGIGEKNYPAASKIIREAINIGLIKESTKAKEYIPSWG